MFIGGILGKSAILTSAIPIGEQYDSCTFNGEINLMNNKMWNIELTDEQIESVGNQEWDANTVFLANYDDTLGAGNIINNDLPITGWIIRRKAEDEPLVKTLSEIQFDENVSEFIDNTPRNKVQYEYFVYPVSGDIEGSPIGGFGEMDFYGWILSDTISATPTQYVFDMEINSGNIQNILDTKVFNTYQRFPVVRQGLLNYRQGEIETIPYRYNGSEIEITDGLLDEIRGFINNGDIKTLRSPSGSAIKVFTEFIDYQYFDKVGSQPYKIRFRWTEIDNA